MKKLFTTQFGSRLYGTYTLESDIDLKHIILPDISDLLLAKQVKNIVKKTNTLKNTKNSAEDVDEEFIPIQVFARDFLYGQTYALELAYAVDFHNADQKIYDLNFLLFCNELRSKFLTSDINAMIGYAVNQASLYSLKGERLNAVKAAEELFSSFTIDKKINELPDFNQKALEINKKFPKYFQVTEYEIDHNGTMRPCIKLLEKILPYTSTVNTNLLVINALLKKYGSRANAASIDNVDWKATAHAIRIVDEGISLLSGNKLIFPFSDEYINKFIKIKFGNVFFKDVINELNNKLEILKTLELESTLPKRSPDLEKELEYWMLTWIRAFYGL